MTFPIIDVCSLWLDRDGWRALLFRLAGFGPRYFSRFAHLLASWAGVDEDQLRAFLDDGDTEAIVDALSSNLPDRLDPQSRAKENARDGIAGEVLHGMSQQLADGSTVNERLLDAAHDLPGAVVWPGVSLTRDAPGMMRELVDQGARGFTASPFEDGIGPRSRGANWFFSTASELGVPVWLHSGAHFRPDVPMDICSWADFDTLAGRWPDLWIVAGHGCWPWLREMVAVMQRHPRVLLELSTHRPSRMARSGSGLEPLVTFGASTVADQVLFGSGGPWVHRRSRQDVAHEVEGLGLGETISRAWLHDNAARLLEETS